MPNIYEQRISSSFNFRYTASFFEFKLTSHTVPTHVSLITKHCELPQNVLKVHLTRRPVPYSRRFTVCLTPLNFQYGRAYELVEWIELNRMLGAEKFIVYNHSSAINIVSVLDFYSKRGLVEVVQWRLPMENQTFQINKSPNPIEIHYFGQIAALHDCLYRNKAYSELIVNIDIDEFIIPHDNNMTTWTDILKQLDNTSAAYIFRNTFFRKEWENENNTDKSLVDKLRLVTLQKLYHEVKVFPPKQRSKYFARTADVTQVLVHDVRYLFRRQKTYIVPVELGTLHHYRDWGNEIDLPNTKVRDDTIPRKFGADLISNVENVWSELTDVRMHIPVQ